MRMLLCPEKYVPSTDVSNVQYRAPCDELSRNWPVPLCYSSEKSLYCYRN